MDQFLSIFPANDSLFFFNEISRYTTIFRNFWWLFTLILIFFSILWFLYIAKHRELLFSRNVLEHLIKNEKYCPNLYVDFENIQRYFRYFINSKISLFDDVTSLLTGLIWQNRLLNEMNTALDPDRKIFAKFYQDILYTKKIHFWYSYKKKSEIICRNLNFFDYRNESKAHVKNPSFPNFATYNSAFKNFGFCNKYEALKKELSISKSHFVILKGTAGNGKTSLLCRFTEILLKKRKSVIFILGRDVSSNIEEYFLKKIGFGEHTIKYWKTLLPFYLFLYRPCFVIDGINENDKSNFSANFFPFIDYLLSKKALVIISCRQEYFDERFKKDIESMAHKPEYIDTVSHQLMSTREKKALLKKYIHYFHTGEPNTYIVEKLFTSLLLFRIYFEVNRNNKMLSGSLYRHKIYKKYIDICLSKYNERERHILNSLLNRLSKEMLDNNTFDYIPIESLTKDFSEIELFRRFSDDNMLTSRIIQKDNDTLAAREQEVVYFNFDELRDFCIARYIFIQSESQPIVAQTILPWANNFHSSFEGVIHYLYLAEKETSNKEVCSLLIEHIFKKNCNKNPKNDDISLTVIFDSDSRLLDCEKNYLRYCMLNKNKLWHISQYAFISERKKIEELFPYILHIVYSKKTLKNLQNVLSEFNLNYNIQYGLIFNKDSIDLVARMFSIAINESICSGFIELLYISYGTFIFGNPLEEILKLYEQKKDVIDKIVETTKCNALKKQLLNSTVYKSKDSITNIKLLNKIKELLK